MQRPDWLIEEPADVYHAKATDYMSSHKLADFGRCPYTFYRTHIVGDLPKPDHSAFAFGRAAHTLILEGEQAYLDEYQVGGPINEKTGKEYGKETKAWKEYAATCKRPMISLEDDYLIRSMRASVAAHVVASQFLKDGIAEGVIRDTLNGVPCQARIDWLTDHMNIVDLKTCQDLTRFHFDARNFGYFHQLAFYRTMVGWQVGKMPSVFVIAVEKSEPFRVGIFNMASDDLDAAMGENWELIEKFRQCANAGEWNTRFTNIRTLRK